MSNLRNKHVFRVAGLLFFIAAVMFGIAALFVPDNPLVGTAATGNALAGLLCLVRYRWLHAAEERGF